MALPRLPIACRTLSALRQYVNLLGEPALDYGCLGERGGVEELGQVGREQTRCIVGLLMQMHCSTETSQRPATTHPCRRNAFPCW